MVDLFLRNKSNGNYPLADFYAGSWEVLMNVAVADKINACLTVDEVELNIWDHAIEALKPYDQKKWSKYFAAIQALQEVNWQTCYEQDQQIADLSDKFVDWWSGFWEREDAVDVLSQNAKDHKDDLDLAIAAL